MTPASTGPNRTAAQRPAPLHAIFIALEVVQHMGVQRELLLRGTGISPAEISCPNAMVTHAQEMILFANALELTGDSAVGLHIGDAIPVTAYGNRGHAMLVSPTLGDAMRLAFDHPLLGISYFRSVMTIEGDVARVIIGGYSYRTDLLVLNTDMLFTAIGRQMRDLLGRRPRFSKIGFTFPAPPHEKIYYQYFNCNVEFNSDVNYIEIDRDLLDSPLPLSHPIEFELAKLACQKKEFELEHWMPSDLVGKLLGILYDDLACQDVGKIAQKLGMSARSLQRKLMEAGTSVTELCEVVRRDLASKLSLERKYSVKEMSVRLGYSNASALSRAMKRWSE
jgi:AraC-like DNA-binding protein